MLTHLLELRRRGLRVILVFLLLFLVFFFFTSSLFHLIISPLLNVLPSHRSLIATQITTPVFLPILLAFQVAMLCTAPYALWEVWLFAAPGLYRREQTNLRFAMISSVVLFCLGVLFCFYMVLPFLLQFFAEEVPPDVQWMPNMSDAIAFIMRMLLLFGLCFQVPLVCFSGVRFGWVSLEKLKMMRSYFIVGAFTIGMMVTPDVLSQLMVSIPLCLLYELGIIFAKLINSTDD